jgi:hypothetical protein
MKRISVQSEMEKELVGFEKGQLVTAQDFLHLGNYEAIKKSLHRLEKDGKVIRVLRGLYRTLNFNQFIQKDVGVSPKKVAEKLAEKYGWKIAPAEDTSLNELGLSTQVPATYTFISDGPYKKYVLDNGAIITFKHRTNKEISTLTTKTATVVEAIQTIKRPNMNADIRQKLLKSMTEADLDYLLNEGKKMRHWIYEEIKLMKSESDLYD